MCELNSGCLLAEERLAGVEQAVDPRQELLGGVIGVEHDRDAVRLGDAAHERGAGERAGDRALLAFVVEELSAEEGAAAVRELNDNGALGFTRGLQSGHHGVRADHVHGGQGSLHALQVTEQILESGTGDHTWLELHFRHGFVSSSW